MLRFVLAKAFFTFQAILMVRLILSWFPRMLYNRFGRLICQTADPYLNLFRGLIPPIGGMLDLSPMLAIMCLNIIYSSLLKLL